MTFVCDIGESKNILEWYRATCGMERFLISREEEPELGSVIEDVGMKLTVGSWVTEWLCKEEGVTWTNDQDNIRCRHCFNVFLMTIDLCLRNFKLVLAEPLPGHEDGHVNTFLRNNDGPGVQHIGLATLDISETVAELNRRGTKFRRPPPTYYKLTDKQEDILTTGHNLDTFRRLGILIDREQTEQTSNSFILGEEEEQNSFLLQIFSFPLFETETFFLELIQRENSRGFGGGNIRALAQSIIEWEREREKLVSSLAQPHTSPTILKTCSSEDFRGFYQPTESFGLRRSVTVQSNLNVVLSH